MTVSVVALFLYVSLCQGQVLTPSRRKHNLANVAKYNDAQHRGERWYDYSSMSKTSGGVSYLTSDSLGSQDTSGVSISHSSEASSAITSERRAGRKTNRKCTSCPYDMLKQWDNRGIKWICGQYQRARRSFKSECMMRYRNCQDGTMFVKMHDHQCEKNSYHGRHWFYIYRV